MLDKLRLDIEKIGEWCKPISSIMPDRQHFSIAFVKMLSMQELLLLVLWVAREINRYRPCERNMSSNFPTTD